MVARQRRFWGEELVGLDVAEEAQWGMPASGTGAGDRQGSRPRLLKPNGAGQASEHRPVSLTWVVTLGISVSLGVK